MRKLLTPLVLAGMILPLLTSALDYSSNVDGYSDAPFSKAETAGISVLTTLDLVEGNPDGTFRPGRTLNRAEFMKIAMGIRKWLNGGFTDAQFKTNCFPDVRDEWFADHVCRAKEQGIVSGNPDGLFHPERPVNYAEALKILVETFDYELPSSGGAWYMPYADAAEMHDVTLTGAVRVDHFLTRGQMARLAAAFVAESEGELDLYRAAERGETVASSSSSRSSSQSSSISSAQSSTSSAGSSSSASSTSSTSSRPTAGLPDLPVRSHFLVLGERSEPVAAVTLFADKEAVFVRSAEIVLDRKIDSIDAMFLVDENGVEIGTLSLDKIRDSTEKTWRGTYQVSGGYRVPKGEERMLAVEVRLKPRGSGGGSDQLVWVRELELTAQGEDSASTYTVNAGNIVFPKHQTAQARITSATNALPATDGPVLGTNQIIAAFNIGGTKVPEADLRVTTLEFQINKSSTVTLSNYQVGSADSPNKYPCSISDSIVSCSNIPAEVGTIGGSPRTIRLYADVTWQDGSGDYLLQVSLNNPGTVGENGAIRWTDGSATFNWTELSFPVARSTKFQ